MGSEGHKIRGATQGQPSIHHFLTTPFPPFHALQPQVTPQKPTQPHTDVGHSQAHVSPCQPHPNPHLGSLTSSRRMKSLANSLVLLKYSSSKS